MSLEESFNFIKEEFQKELDKRKELLKEIENLKHENETLNRDLKAYRYFYPMKNEVCGMCEFADECIDANRVEGRRFCSSFHAKLEDEE